MLELALLSFWCALMLMGLKRPFIWVLAYIYVDVIGPQKVGWAILPKIPFSLITFAVMFLGWALLDRKQGVHVAFRQVLLVFLLGWCALTLSMADFPVEAATKWDWVWKVLVAAIFLPLALTTRLRIEAVALFLVLAIGTVTINGGIKTVLGGGGYAQLSFFVQEDSGIYETSTLSTAAIVIIPIALWLARFGTIFPPDWRVRLFVGALIFACLLIPVGAEARTGLLCIAALGLLLLRTVKNRMLYLACAGAALMVAVPFLPNSFTARMETIKDHQADQSASTRLAVWGWTLNYAMEHPMGGGFNAFLGNSVSYETTQVVTSGSSTVVETQEVADQARAYHSSYFEMLGEQGWLGLGVWLLFHGLGLVQMERVRRQFRTSQNRDEQRMGHLANALQQSHVIYLVGALFVGVAYQSFIYVIAAMEMALAYQARQNRPATGAGRRGRPVQAAGGRAAQIAEPDPAA